MLARKAKNQYTWKGFAVIPEALRELKDEGLKENLFDAANDSAKVSDDEYDEEANPATGSQNDKSNSDSATLVKSSQNENRKEKSLTLLTQNFVKLFVCSNIQMVSLDDAAKLLLGNVDTAMMRTKVRRLYDIANVLSSINLIEKTHMAESRKPAFRWLGLKGKTMSESGNSAQDPNTNESRKRLFGSDITNISFKRNKVDLFMNEGDFYKNSNMENKHDNLNCQGQSEKSNSKQDAKQTTGCYQFGPFAPRKVGASENDNVKQVHDWESLAKAHRPQYENLALRDLFSHYTEAWKSWYSEVAGKRP